MRLEVQPTGRKRAERGGPGGLRKERSLAVGSTWPWKSVFVGHYGKKAGLGGKVMGGQMTSPHTGSFGSFGETAAA